MDHASKLKWLRAGTWTTALLMLSPFISAAGTTWGMVLALEKHGDAAIDDPQLMGATVGELLISIASAIIIAIPAFGLFLVCYLPYRRLKKLPTTPPPLPPEAA